MSTPDFEAPTVQMTIAFPGGDRVDASFADLRVATDQDGSAPSPFQLFLASIGTCAGIYVLRFCRHRGIPTDGVRVVERTHTDRESGMVATLELEIQVPPDFPAKYHAALVRAVDQCAVKRHLADPPAIHVETVVTD